VVKGIRLQEARTYIKEAVKKSPENPAVVDSMGWVTYKLGDPEAALPWLEKAFKLAADGEIGAHIVEVLAELGRLDEAKTFYANVVAEFPDHELVKAIGQKLWPK
jgi:tetratricopeptide (TPR) repeat protein